MDSQDPIEQLLCWIQEYDPSLLHNEDDVETKFVLPLFRYLGYPETCRRGKYPLKTYSPGGKGRKPEIDQIYFAERENTKQNGDTSLIIVEAKEPEETSLEGAIDQARFYGDRLTPPFLVATNGYRVTVLKRRGFRGDEILFEITTTELKDPAIAVNFYNQLNFNIVKHVKVHLTDTLSHEQYVRLERDLRQYPDLQAQLDKGNFQPMKVQEGSRLTVVYPKVAIVCDLPIGFEEGSCKIQFSNIMLRSLSIELNHESIMRELMMGLHTLPHWKLRSFLTCVDGRFEAKLGQTTVTLSETEAEHLCCCVDIICTEYKRIIVEAETLLETWDYHPVQVEDIRGFHLLSVKNWLWELMKQFALDFGYTKGISEWHMFDAGSELICIHHRDTLSQAYLWPKADQYIGPSAWLDLLYQVPPIYHTKLSRYETESIRWQRLVGPRGLWTAHYTNRWLVRSFIPKILEYFPRDPNVRQFNWARDVDDCGTQVRAPLNEVTEIKQLGPYIRMVGFLLPSPSIRNAAILRGYYQAMTELAQRVDPSTINLGYVASNSTFLYYKQHQDRIQDREVRYNRPSDYYIDVLPVLYENVSRIKHVEYEEYVNLDQMTRVFAAIIEEGEIEFTQAQLNAAKQAMIPIWELYRFEGRYLRS